MARFKGTCIEEIANNIKSIDKFHKACHKAVDAGADIVVNNLRNRTLKVFKHGANDVARGIFKSITYNRIVGDIACAIGFRGYLRSNPKKPIPLIVNVKEKGTSKTPPTKVLRTNIVFNKNQVESKMKEVFKKYEQEN